ncbi:MAG TPA: CNNM domain-containing protein, partial [Planctomycetaceae bacterium]
MSDLFPLLWLPSLAMLALVAASAFFSASETALFYLSPDELRSMRAGPPREQAAAALLGSPDRLLTGLLFWN